jgi:hypothetical protein
MQVEGVLAPDPAEVERVLSLDLSKMLARGEVDALVVPRADGFLMPIFIEDGLVVFGATALVLYELLTVLGGALPLRPTHIDWEVLLREKAWALGR